MQSADKYPILDVRSPGEFSHAHIPGAYSLPLFTDEERKKVGTLYKQVSREAAIKDGLKYFGSRMTEMIERVEAITKEFYNSPDAPANGSKTVLVHCWRGGMRSAGVAWLLDLYGFRVLSLAGGYKSFRNLCTAQLDKQYPLVVIGGYTGSGKTQLLHSLRQKNKTIVDLEALASNKGSAFGNLGQPPQPSQEMFENMLAISLMNIPDNDIVWIEDESQRIGSVNIPTGLFRSIQAAKLYFLNMPFEERLQNIVKEYGDFDKEKLADGILRIKKRLGGLETKTALSYLDQGEMENCFGILLRYYDKYYRKCLEEKHGKTRNIVWIECNTSDTVTDMRQLLLLQEEPEVVE